MRFAMQLNILVEYGMADDGSSYTIFNAEYR